MLAKENATYALIMDSKVHQIFTKETLAEWSDDLNVIEIPTDKINTVYQGMEYKDGNFIEIDLTKNKILFLNEYFDNLLDNITGNVSPNEKLTWDLQVREAIRGKEILSSYGNELTTEALREIESETPYIYDLSKYRSENYKEVVNKIIEKSTVFKKIASFILGKKQELTKRLETGENMDLLNEIETIKNNTKALIQNMI